MSGRFAKAWNGVSIGGVGGTSPGSSGVLAGASGGVSEGGRGVSTGMSGGVSSGGSIVSSGDVCTEGCGENISGLKSCRLNS